MVPDDLRNFADPRDIDEFIAGLRKFESGECSADDFRKFRLARGTYGQRQADVNMLRIKIPQGILQARQLEELAAVAEEESRGFGHVTTRQNIQFHFVKLDRVADIQARLAKVGLTTREACGNTVRNITGCALAGTCTGEPFDVTPYAEAVTRAFLRNPICQDLPRKFKIAFSGCEGDCAQGAINDIGLRALERAGRPGFRVVVGGGLSTSPENAHLLFEFVEANELIGVCEAVLRVFDRLGNRKNKARARLKYVIRKLGFEGFRREFTQEWEAIKAEERDQEPIAPRPESIASDPRPQAEKIQPSTLPGFSAFAASNLLLQRQTGFVTVLVRLIRGDLTAAQFRGVGTLARDFGSGEARLTNDQNLALRFIRCGDVAAVYERLVTLDLALAGARTIADVTACPGADTCNLAVTQSRELALALSGVLDDAVKHGNDAVQDAQTLDIKISGCPNSCGQHHVAAIGFHGTMRRLGERTVPEYQLHLGGGIDADGATFGRQIVKIPARRAADALLRLLDLYKTERREEETPLAFFRRVDEASVKAAVRDLQLLDEANIRPDDFHDLGEERDFKVMIGAGECAS